MRYEISAYGDYFSIIPGRLGTSPVLDAAAWPFASAHSAVYEGQVSPDAIVAYNTTLRRLGEALPHPTQRHEPTTLLALHLVQIVQSWIDQPDDPYANHTLTPRPNCAELDEPR